MEERNANVIIAKSGGHSSKNSYNCKVSLPKVWVDRMGISLDERGVTLTFDGECIVIKKAEV